MAEIYSYGKPLIESSFFGASKKQIHHRKTTLYNHIMNVTYYAVLLCDAYEKAGRTVNRKRAVTGALCHDLGMIGRDRLYSNDITAWLRHPRVSAERATEFFPDCDSETVRIIKRHMWPVTVIPPLSPEGWIVIKADKAASYDDLRGVRRLASVYEKSAEDGECNED